MARCSSNLWQDARNWRGSHRRNWQCHPWSPMASRTASAQDGSVPSWASPRPLTMTSIFWTAGLGLGDGWGFYERTWRLNRSEVRFHSIRFYEFTAQWSSGSSFPPSNCNAQCRIAPLVSTQPCNLNQLVVNRQIGCLSGHNLFPRGAIGLKLWKLLKLLMWKPPAMPIALVWWSSWEGEMGAWMTGVRFGWIWQIMVDLTSNKWNLKPCSRRKVRALLITMFSFPKTDIEDELSQATGEGWVIACRHCGYLTMMSVLAARHVDICLLPEMDINLDKVGSSSAWWKWRRGWSMIL